MKVSLKVLDRLILSVTLPQTGNFVSMLTAADIKEKVKLTAEEQTAISLRDGPNGPVWNMAADVPVEFVFTVPETGLINQTLEKMDKEQKLTIDHVGLYKAFLGMKVIPFDVRGATKKELPKDIPNGSPAVPGGPPSPLPTQWPIA